MDKERRRQENQSIRVLIGTYKEYAKQTVETVGRIESLATENGKKLDIVNGSVKRHKAHFVDVFNRLRKVEDSEILQEGIRTGTQGMKTSTRNMIIIVMMALCCLFAGIRIFKSSQTTSQETIKKVIEEAIQGLK